jgi:hypothetical protein
MEPGTGSRGEVQMETWMSSQPGLDAGMIMSSIVVDNQMQIPVGGSLPVKALEEADEFLMAMMRQ